MIPPTHSIRRSLFVGSVMLCISFAAGCVATPHSGSTMQRTELYFGLTRPSGPDVMEIEFQTFLDSVVTPRFPQGFTVLTAQGHWREQTGIARTEPSHVLIILHSDSPKAHRKIEEIRAAYKKQFSQEAVLRVDDTETVSF